MTTLYYRPSETTPVCLQSKFWLTEGKDKPGGPCGPEWERSAEDDRATERLDCSKTSNFVCILLGDFVLTDQSISYLEQSLPCWNTGERALSFSPKICLLYSVIMVLPQITSCQFLMPSQRWNKPPPFFQNAHTFSVRRHCHHPQPEGLASPISLTLKVTIVNVPKQDFSDLSCQMSFSS